MVSKYYPMFCALGYPQLDVVKYDDGEWSIIEYVNAPLVPSLTKWQHVLKGLRNIEITEGFIKKFVRQIDPKEKQFWEREQARTEHMEKEKEEQEKHAIESADRTANVLMKNEALKERFVKNGAIELDLSQLAKYIPSTQLKEICKS
jgi:hypothetical protein